MLTMIRLIGAGLLLASLLADGKPFDTTPEECGKFAACAYPWNGEPEKP